MTAHAKKETPAFFSRPVAEPKENPRRCREFGHAASFLLSLSVPKPNLQPLKIQFLCPIFTNRKQWKYYSNAHRDCQDSAKDNKKAPTRKGRNEPGYAETNMYNAPVTKCLSVHTDKKPRFGQQNRTGIRRNQYVQCTSHELSAATRRSEMTLDYSFLSDSRNFFV